MPSSYVGYISTRLEKVNLGCSGRLIFSQTGDRDSHNTNLTLSKLNLSGNRHSSLPPEFQSLAVLRLEEVNLTRTFLTTDQVLALFTAVAERENSKLRNLDICCNILLFAPADNLTQACLKLTRLNIRFCRLQENQFEFHHFFSD